jgi:peptidoglycan/LPS O-acetylase OafA/YrhL
MELSIRPAAASHQGERSSNQLVETEKPARLDALTGLRSFAAVNIVLFHFSNPDWFGPFAPVVNAGYASVSFFILLSGFVLGYNYNRRARAGKLETKRFYEARFTRLYPIYLLSLILAFKLLPVEWGSHTHGMFWTGVVLSPLLLQGWIPEIATFLNTPAWTMSAESFYYVLFPWMARWKKPDRIGPHIAKMGLVWILALVPGTLYLIYNPDGLPHLDRFSYGKWLQALKYTPIPHLASFVFGVLLAELDEVIPRMGKRRLVMGIFGFVGTFFVLTQAYRLPYPLLHDGFFMPLFGCIVLGLAGINPLSKVFGLAPLVFVGEASYCLYLLHFNLWNMIHDSHLLDRLGLARFDPWISYLLLIGLALLALHFIEKPAQRILRNWMHV